MPVIDEAGKVIGRSVCLSYLIPSHLILSYYILSYPTLFYLIISYHIISYSILFRDSHILKDFTLYQRTVYALSFSPFFSFSFSSISPLSSALFFPPFIFIDYFRLLSLLHPLLFLFSFSSLSSSVLVHLHFLLSLLIHQLFSSVSSRSSSLSSLSSRSSSLPSFSTR